MRWTFSALVFACALSAPVAASRPGLRAADVSQQREAPQDAGAIVVTSQRYTDPSDWVRLETPHFAIYSANPREARSLAARLETLHQILILTTNTVARDARPLPVYLVNGTPQIERLRMQRALPGYFFTGYYSSAPTGTLVAVDLFWDTHYAHSDSYVDGWLFTEYVQHFLVENARGNYIPDWYMHGLSLYFSTAKFNSRDVEYGRFHPSLVSWLERGDWEPVSRIISGGLTKGQKYSAECALLVHYILAEPRRGQAFREFLAAVQRGEAAVPAFEAAFRTTMSRLQSTLWRYRADAKFVHASLTGFDLPPPTVSQLPKSADTLLLDRAAMQIGIVEPDRQKAVLARAERVVAERSDPFAQRVLAQARILYGDPEQAAVPLAGLLQTAASDPEILYLEGLRHLAAGRKNPAAAQGAFSKARNWFRQAYRADPTYYPALYGWAESLSTEPEFASEDTLNLLLKAAELAPQATQIRVSAALLLMYMERYGDAETLLAPLIVSPRNPASAQVPALLARARTSVRPSLDDVGASFRYTAVWKDLNCC